MSDTDAEELVRIAAALPETDVLKELARRLATLITEGRGASPWMSAPQAAEYLGWPIKRVYNLTAAQAMPHHRQGGRLIFRRDELDAWLDDHYCGPARLAS